MPTAQPCPEIEIGLLADTHLPYRVSRLNPAIIEALRGVALIIHAGDVDEPEELAPLQAIAPLYAVRGNYHIRERSHAGAALPWSVELTLCGFRIIVEHGHRIGADLWLWKAASLFRHLILHRWDFPALERRMIAVLLQRHPRADIIVFGHTHRFYAAYHGQTLLINPGAAMPTAYFEAPFRPSVVRMRLLRQRRPHIERRFIPAEEVNLHDPGTYQT